MERYDAFEKGFARKTELPKFEVGDTVDVMVTIKEGDKERVQVFNGTVIGKRGHGTAEMFTVRRIVQDEGVERTFPVNSPKIAGLDIKRRGRVRRAKLNYLRERTGKSTRLTERILKEVPGAAKAGGANGAGRAKKSGGDEGAAGVAKAPENA